MCYQLLLQHSCNHKSYGPIVPCLPPLPLSLPPTPHLPTQQLILIPNTYPFYTSPLNTLVLAFDPFCPPCTYTLIHIAYSISPLYLSAWETGPHPYLPLPSPIPLLASPLSRADSESQKTKPKHLKEQPGYGIYTPGDVPSSIKRVKKLETLGEKQVETEFFEAGPQRENGFKGWSDVWGKDEGGLPPGWRPDRGKKDASAGGDADEDADGDRDGDVASDRATMGSTPLDYSSMVVVMDEPSEQ